MRTIGGNGTWRPALENLEAEELIELATEVHAEVTRRKIRHDENTLSAVTTAMSLETEAFRREQQAAVVAARGDQEQQYEAQGVKMLEEADRIRREKAALASARAAEVMNQELGITSASPSLPPSARQAP